MDDGPATRTAEVVASVGTGRKIGPVTLSVQYRDRAKARALLRVLGEDEGPDTAELRAERPRTREECVNGPRPCPWASCRHHLFLVVNRTNGSITISDPSRPIWEMLETCALDVAARGGMDLEAISKVQGITRERVRQVEESGMARMSVAPELASERRDESPAARETAKAARMRLRAARQARGFLRDRLLELVDDQWRTTGDLAVLSGSTRQTAAPALKRLVGEGVLERRRRPVLHEYEYRVTRRNAESRDVTPSHERSEG